MDNEPLIPLKMIIFKQLKKFMVNTAKKPEGGKKGQRRKTQQNKEKLKVKTTKKDTNFSSLTHL